jgi:lipopolysaccharide export system protein LptC
MKTFITILVVVTLALLSIWLQDLFKETPIIRVEKDKHFPDYFLENFNIVSLDENGQPAYMVTASRLDHYADDDSAELQHPLIEFVGDGNDWSISAQRAIIAADKTIIHLYDQVEVKRIGNAQQRDLNIATDYLKIHTDSKIAETDRPARIRTSDLELDTIGMVFDNSQGILKLMSQVKGTYEPAH